MDQGSFFPGYPSENGHRPEYRNAFAPYGLETDYSHDQPVGLDRPQGSAPASVTTAPSVDSFPPAAAHYGASASSSVLVGSLSSSTCNTDRPSTHYTDRRLPHAEPHHMPLHTRATSFVQGGVGSAPSPSAPPTVSSPSISVTHCDDHKPILFSDPSQASDPGQALKGPQLSYPTPSSPAQSVPLPELVESPGMSQQRTSLPAANATEGLARPVFTWQPTEVVTESQTSTGIAVVPEIHARVDKGLNQDEDDSRWFCYRRNYFTVVCSFELRYCMNKEPIYVKHDGRLKQVKATGVRMTANVLGPNGKAIDLVLHTPKRDNGPKYKIEIVKIVPMPSTVVDSSSSDETPDVQLHPAGPHLPFQEFLGDGAQTDMFTRQYSRSVSTGSHLQLPGYENSHTFERVQFKQATANNGKRRASQQYFNLALELWADVRDDVDARPVWVKMAYKLSDKIIVRGRSPHHYRSEAQKKIARRAAQGGVGGHLRGHTSHTRSGARRTNNQSRSHGRSEGGHQYSPDAYNMHDSPTYSDHSSSGGSMAYHMPDPPFHEHRPARLVYPQNDPHYPVTQVSRAPLYPRVDGPVNHPLLMPATTAYPRMDTPYTQQLSIHEPADHFTRAQYTDNNHANLPWPSTTVNRQQYTYPERRLYQPDYHGAGAS